MRVLLVFITAAMVMWVAVLVFTRVVRYAQPPDVMTMRSRRLAAFARQIGWDFVPQSLDLVALCSNLPVAPAHSPSRRSLAENVLHGPLDGWSLLVFEYVTWDARVDDPTWDSGVPSATRHTVWALPLPARLPWVQVTPRGLHARLLGDKVITGDRAFDQALCVRAEAPAFALTVLTPAVRQLLLDTGPVGWRIDEQHRYLLCWAEGPLADPDELLGQARGLVRLHALLPDRDAQLSKGRGARGHGAQPRL